MVLDEYLSANIVNKTIYKNSGTCKGEIVLQFKTKDDLNWHCIRHFDKWFYNPFMKRSK